MTEQNAKKSCVLLLTLLAKGYQGWQLKMLSFYAGIFVQLASMDMMISLRHIVPHDPQIDVYLIRLQVMTYAC